MGRRRRKALVGAEPGAGEPKRWVEVEAERAECEVECERDCRGRRVSSCSWDGAGLDVHSRSVQAQASRGRRIEG